MKARVTENFRSLSDKLTGNLSSVKDKAFTIYEHVKSIPYSTFAVVDKNIDKLLDGNPLTCYGKALVQATLLEASNVPWRFEISSCPSHAVEETIKLLSDDNPIIMKLFKNFPGLFEGKRLMHTTVQAKIGDEWKRMDSTIPKSVCNKIKNEEKRKQCFSTDNVSAIHQCDLIGYSHEIPRKIVSSWNLISKIGNWVNDKIKTKHD